MLNDYIEFKKNKEGDIKAFEKIFRRYYSPLYLYALSITGQKEAAEEIVQNTFYTIWKEKEKIQILHSIKSYLYKSVKNRSLQYLEHLQVREKYRENVLLQYNLVFEPAPDELLEYKELEEALRQALRKLPERRRKIFHMYRTKGRKYKEIAESLSISIKTVEAEMAKAYRTLRKEIEKYTQNKL
jgi:RNA polymerase sigma-70 factor (ECF subfamily)